MEHYIILHGDLSSIPYIDKIFIRLLIDLKPKKDNGKGHNMISSENHDNKNIVVFVDFLKQI